MKRRKCSTNEGINNVYTVETIYKKKMRNNKEPLYFIKWKDWDDKYNSWEPLSNILDHSLIETFEDEIRQKQKMRKEATKHKKIDWEKLDYESDVKSESHKEVDESIVENTFDIEKKDMKTLNEVTPTEELPRPKICIKIPKYRLHPPHSSTISNSFDVDQNSPEIEKPRHGSNHSDEESFSMHRLSPIHITQSADCNKLSGEEFHKNKVSKKQKQIHKNPSIHISKINAVGKKPRKLLSINEYSAVIKMKKKHHKKSKHGKHRSESKIFQSSKTDPKGSKCAEKIESSEWEIKTAPKERTKDVEKGSKVQKTGSSLRAVGSKLEMKPIRFQSQTIITDVTVNGLCVTVREMGYDDFVSDSGPRHQMVRLPIHSDWKDRYLGRSEEKHDLTEEEDQKEVVIVEHREKKDKNKKQKMLDKFEERIIPGLRPPSRPRSVDSYKNIIDKTMHGININHLNESATSAGGGGGGGGKIVPETGAMILCDEDQGSRSNPFAGKSPLNVIVDESEEVDVVGGIDSAENSFLSSVQSTRTTVTTQLRQARLSAQSPVSNIIQSLWHSYSYNSSPLGMPPLQAAPWVQSPEVVSPLQRHMGHHHNSYLSRPSSIDPAMLKYSQSVPPLYSYQQSPPMPNFYVHHCDERPIDLSFK